MIIVSQAGHRLRGMEEAVMVNSFKHQANLSTKISSVTNVQCPSNIVNTDPALANVGGSTLILFIRGLQDKEISQQLSAANRFFPNTVLRRCLTRQLGEAFSFATMQNLVKTVADSSQATVKV